MGLNLAFTTHQLCVWRRQWHPTPVLLPGKSHGRRSLVGCSPWGRQESDTTERLHFHFSLSCIGEGNGNPLQCSCLENSRDRGAWWAAVYGVTQSRTWLKRFSSSSSSIPEINTLLSVNFTSINKTKSKIQTPKKHFAQAWATVSTQNMVDIVIAMTVMLALILILMLVIIQY